MSKWKPILGYEDCYRVSDDGQVIRISTGKTLAKRVKKGGYVTYHLCRNGERKDPLAQRLVWEAFNGRIPEGLEINHKNGNKLDNRLENLEAVTRSENMKHKFRMLHYPPPNNPSRGSKNGCAKLTEADIPKIFELSRKGMYQYEIAKLFGVSQPAIGNVLLGKKWKHVSKDGG